MFLMSQGRFFICSFSYLGYNRYHWYFSATSWEHKVMCCKSNAFEATIKTNSNSATQESGIVPYFCETYIHQCNKTVWIGLVSCRCHNYYSFCFLSFFLSCKFISHFAMLFLNAIYIVLFFVSPRTFGKPDKEDCHVFVSRNLHFRPPFSNSVPTHTCSAMVSLMHYHGYLLAPVVEAKSPPAVYSISVYHT